MEPARAGDLCNSSSEKKLSTLLPIWRFGSLSV
jgi:hypothetical protein